MNIIDRRLNPREKNLNNRQRFIERSREHIKKVVHDAVRDGTIKDAEGRKVKVPVKGTKEPTFRHDGKSGDQHYVVPGNKEYVEGDQIEKPQGGGGGKGNKASNDGLGEDEFVFTLTEDEFLEFFFEDLELPDLVKKQFHDLKKTAPKRAGYTNVGNPCQLDIKATMKHSLGRRIGLKRPDDEKIAEIEASMEKAKKADAMRLYADLELELRQAKRRMKAIPWLDPVDVRFRNFVPQPKPVTRAAMICLMDVSGSMGEREKDIAKRFFMLLYMFLNRKYENVEIVFVRHHTTAQECTEQEFFYERENGGTLVSSGLAKVREIIAARYPTNDWNIYVAQASDGDNYSSDNDDCLAMMAQILPIVQYFAYIDIVRDGSSMWFMPAGDTDLWKTYKKIAANFKNMAMRKVESPKHIWGVFRDLFSKDRANTSAK